MYKTNLRTRNLRAVLLTGAATATVFAFVGPAVAQTTSAGAVENVVITGSRLPQTGLTSVSPITTVGQQEAKFEGTTNVETLLNNLPQTFAGFGSHDSNGASGTATVDLRGLGPKRTLVLVDGRRLMPGDPGLIAADLNAIPAALIERVEVETGGASAVYGSDALAGVVNFIMRKDFEGIEWDGQFTKYNDDNSTVPFVSHAIDVARSAGADAISQYPHAPKNQWDGDTVDGTLIIGANTDNGKGNVTAYIGYRHIHAVTENAREYSACSTSAKVISPSPKGVENDFRCFGSANKNYWVSIDDYYAGQSYSLFQEGTGASGSGHFVPFTGSSNQRFNFAPYNYIQRPDTRWTAGFMAHYEVNKYADVYSNFMFADDHTVAAIAPSGLFAGQGPNGTAFIKINCDNPLMTAAERAQLCGFGPVNGPNDDDADAGDCVVSGVTGNCNLIPGFATVEIGRRNIEGGPRTDDIRHTSYRAIVGVKGDLGDGWSYDVFGQYGYTIFQNLTSGYWSIQKTQNALQVDPGTGKCFVGGACVPLDIFNGIGSVTQKMEAYIAATGFRSGFTQERLLGGQIVGDLSSVGIRSPWAKDAAAVVFGTEYRDEGLKFDASSDFSSADLGGGGGAIHSLPFGHYSVKEGFAELRIPLIEDAPYAKLLQVHGAYRYSFYDTAKGVSTYSYDAEWQPIDDFRLRASYQRAVRAPNVVELFTPQAIGLFGGQDPCSAAGAPSASTLANCTSSHANPEANVPNAGSGLLNCISAQCNANFGGNPNLKPEISDTRSAGVVLTPTFLPGFTATIDYFDIRVSGFIGIVPPGLTLQQCYVNNVQFFCNLVHRSLPLHQIWGGSGNVSALNLNTGSLDTKGWDFAANYQADLADWGMGNNGSLGFSFTGTLLNNLTTQSLPGSTPYDCSGFFGANCGTPNPKWRHNLRVTWSSPWDVDLSVLWRHFGGTSFAGDSANPLLGGSPLHLCAAGSTAHGTGQCDEVDEAIPSFNYFDISAVWHVWDNVEVRAGVNNVFDKTPPIVDSNTFGISSPPFGNGNTFPNVYDPLGRTVFVGATVKM